MSEEYECFTVVFEGDIRKLPGNPHKIGSPFGPIRSIGVGDAFKALDADSDDTAQTPAPTAHKILTGLQEAIEYAKAETEPAPETHVAASIDDQIDAWHDGASAGSLAAHLGMTEAEYGRFVTDTPPPSPHKQASEFPPSCCTAWEDCDHDGVCHDPQQCQAVGPNARGPQMEPCERCQGNGEIVTDWERYRHPHEGDVGDEAVTECPECNGAGEIEATHHPQRGRLAPMTADQLHLSLKAARAPAFPCRRRRLCHLSHRHPSVSRLKRCQDGDRSPQAWASTRASWGLRSWLSPFDGNDTTNREVPRAHTSSREALSP